MRVLRLAAVLIVLLTCASAATAFDNERRGFILSAGLGYSPYAGQDQKHNDIRFKESGPAFASSLDIGWGWDDHNVLLFGGNTTMFKSDLFAGQRFSQGYAGFSWNHYFGPMGRSWFSAVGVGTYSFWMEDGYEQRDMVRDSSTDEYVAQAASPRRRGLGLLLGGGYEFAEHFQAGVFVSGGRTEAFSVDIEHVQVSVLVQWMAF